MIWVVVEIMNVGVHNLYQSNKNVSFHRYTMRALSGTTPVKFSVSIQCELCASGRDSRITVKSELWLL